mgnify:CR=1 FL=1
MSTQATPAAGGNVTDLKTALAALEKFTGKAAPVAAPPVAQTDEQAMQTAVNQARDLYAKMESLEAKEAVVLKLNATLVERDRQIAEFKKAHPVERKSEFDLTDARQAIAETAGMIGMKTKDLFTNLGALHATKQKAYVQRFGFSSEGSKGFIPKPIELIMRGSFGTDPKSLTKMNTFTVGSEDQVIRHAQDLNDAVFFWWMDRCSKNMPPVAMNTCPLWEDYQVAVRDMASALTGKALDETDTSNFVPTGFSSALIERYELDRNVVKYLRTYQVPRSPFKYPSLSTRGTTFKIAENTADPESATAVTTSDLTDQGVTFTLVRMGVRTSASYDLDEDSIVPLMQVMRDELGRWWAYGEEDAIINGDTTASHVDSDITSATDVRKALYGFRPLAWRNSYYTDINAHTAESYSGMIGSMGTYGVRTKDLAWIIPPTVRAKLLVLKDSSNNPVMLGNWNQGSTQIQNLDNVPSIFGVPVVVAECFRQNLNAIGLYDGTTLTKTGVLLVNVEAWRYAYNALPPLVESWRWIRTLQNEIVISTRRDLQPIQVPVSSNKVVWLGVNITS